MWLAFRLFCMVVFLRMKSSGNSATQTGSTTLLRGGSSIMSGALGAQSITAWIAGGCVNRAKEGK